MPLYDFVCKTCQHQFEALVLGGRVPVCASCGGTELERLQSMPYVKSESTKALSMKAAKKRDKSQARQQAGDQIAYEKTHDND